MFIDTHCHLSGNDYDDITTVVDENKKAGVSKIIISGCTVSDLEETMKIINNYLDVYATIGYHPEEADHITKKDLIKLEELLCNDKIVGLGEIGLDYHYSSSNSDSQKQLFEYQLSLAEKYNLPVVIHTRDATNDTIEILKNYKLKGIIHCFSGSYETACQYIKLGYLLGIGGVVTFKNCHLKEVLKKISLDNIVLETDSPYLSPVPYRGKINSSKNIPIIASFLSNELGTSIEKIEETTTRNATSLFTKLRWKFQNSSCLDFVTVLYLYCKGG